MLKQTFHNLEVLRSVQRFIKRSMAIRLFDGKDHANLYAAYRPTHTENLYKRIIEFHDSGKIGDFDHGLAVDIGCGNGQSSRPLCQYFQRVIGSDVSEQQIKLAKRDLPNLTFKVGPGEDLSFLEDNSTDLITLSSAIHWLNTEKFYPEVERVLKPGGVIAAYAYGNNVVDIKEANDSMIQFYSKFLKGYWDSRRTMIDEEYASVELPFADRIRVQTDDISIKREIPVDAYIGYLSTWSGWQTYLKKHPGSNALQDLQEKFSQLYGDRNVMVKWPVFLLMGRKSQ